MTQKRVLSLLALLALILAALPLGLQTASAQSGVNVTIDSGTRFQVIDGFGTCLAGSEAEQTWWQDLYYGDAGSSILRVDLTPRFKSPYSDNTYNSPWFHNNPALPGPDNNNVRTYTGPNDYSRSFAGKNAPIAVMKTDIEQNIGVFDYAQDLPRPGIAAAKAGELRKSQLGDFKLVGSLWSPVPWVKITSGNSISGQSGVLPGNGTPWPFIWFDNFAGGKLDISGTPLAVFNDGSQNTSSLTQFARSTAAYILGYQRAAGKRFYAISIQNELNFEQFYNSATYPLSSQYITAVKAIRAEFDRYPELRDIKIMGPEDLMGGDAYAMWEYGGPVHKNLQYLQNIAADPQAAAAVSFFNIHGYAPDGVGSAGANPQSWDWWANGWDASPAGGVPANVKGFTEYGKKSWMTETSGETTAWLDTSSGFPSNGGWSIALKMHQALTTGQQSAWVYWQFSDGSANAESTLTDATLRQNAPKYVAFKHFSKYIRPNAQRVAATVSGSSTLSASAYVHDANKTVTTVLVNSSASPQTVSVRLPATPGGITSVQTFTSSNGALWQTGTASVSGGSVSITVPGYGVATLYGQGSSTTPTNTAIPPTPTNTPVPPTPTTPPTGGSGTGLRAEYFNNISLTGSPALVRTDAQVNTDWGTGGPGSPIGTDNFSVRWTGQVEAPTSGSYTFTTTSDDGVRLWVNNQQLVNNWTDHGSTDNSGTITLNAGQKYSITTEFYERGGGAVARLQWAYPGQTRQAIPQTRLYPATGTSPTATPVLPTATPVPPTATPGSTSTTITFEGATNATYTSYTEGGFIFTEGRGGEALYPYGTGEGYSSRVITPQNWSGRITIAKSGGGSFNLTSFGYATGRWGDAGDATVTGTRSDGTTVTQTYSFTSSRALSTATLNWSNLTQVVINFDGGSNNVYGAIDNVVVQ